MNRPAKTRGAFALIELILMLLVIVIILIVLTASLSKGRARVARRQCVDNLKHLGLAARIFASANKNAYPGELISMTNFTGGALDSPRYFSFLAGQLGSPRILHCPADKRAEEAPALNVVTARNISYFANLTAREAIPTGFLFGDANLQLGTNGAVSGLLTISSNSPLSWTRERHWNQGNVALADGSVQQFNNAFLQRQLLQSGVSSNLLLFP